MVTSKKLGSAVLLTLSLLLLTPTNSSIANAQMRKGLPPHAQTRSLTRAEIRDAEARLAEMGYGTGRVDGVIDGVTRNALIAFQKYEGRKVTGQLSRADFDAIMNASA